MTCVIFFYYLRKQTTSPNHHDDQQEDLGKKRKYLFRPCFFYDIQLWPVTELPANEKSLSISFACFSSSVCCVLIAKK